MLSDSEVVLVALREGVVGRSERLKRQQYNCFDHCYKEMNIQIDGNRVTCDEREEEEQDVFGWLIWITCH